MSTHSNYSADAESSCCSAAQLAQIVTGALAVVGAATILWVIFSGKRARVLDPQVDIDERINALEDSLSQLQETFGHAVVTSEP